MALASLTAIQGDWVLGRMILWCVRVKDLFAVDEKKEPLVY